MPKINQEEYELLKSLDDGWEWLARDEGGRLYKFLEKPRKVNDFNWNDPRETWLGMDDGNFQFIQWEDDEPYNIQELIEKYEKNLTETIFEEEKETFEKLAESEETEVKDIEWAKKEILEEIDIGRERYYELGGNTRERSKGVGKVNGLIIAKDILEEVDQETLSSDWIDENKVMFFNAYGENYYVHIDKLQNMLVPKQEEITEEQAWEVISGRKDIEKNYYKQLYDSLIDLWSENKGFSLYEFHKEVIRRFKENEKPVIPQYVAEVIKDHKEQKYDIYDSLDIIITTNGEGIPDISNWLADANNIDVYASAWLAYPNIEVEEEPKYVIKLDDESYLQRYEINNKNAVTPFRIVGHLKEVAIKFDNREKAKKVAELVEGEVEEVEE